MNQHPLNDRYSAEAMTDLLRTLTVGRPTLFFEQIDSTNSYAKLHAAEGGSHGTVIVAASQTAGRGRMGRSFSSAQEMGIYLSVLLRPQLKVTDLMSVTLLAAVAVKETIGKMTGVSPAIKWTNDIYLNGKKCCGILTEGSVRPEDGMLEHLIIGIGVNLTQRPDDFPEELRKIATSILHETGVRLSRAAFTVELLLSLEQLFCDGKFPENKDEVLARYRDALLFLGERVTVHTAKGSYPATAIDIDGEGRLIVERDDGLRQALESGEISVRPI